MSDCPFCKLPPEQVLARSERVQVIRDSFPVSPGHTLVMPLRHVADYFDVSAEERKELWAEVEAQKTVLDSELAPTGYNVGINVGESAGQTVMHVHIHLIPRFDGDQPDPRGGVRGVIPEKQKYA